VFDEVPARRRRTLLQAAQRVAEHGWLKQRPVQVPTRDVELDQLNKLRDDAPISTRNADAQQQRDTSAQVPSLLKVTREKTWLKVDSIAAYR